MTYETSRDWQPLQKAAVPKNSEEELIQVTMDQYKIGRDDARALLDHNDTISEYWINGLYQVQVQRYPNEKITTLNIRRRDGKAIFRDWRHFQWIKNQLVGEECEAVELYPAESRLVDTSNKYHLFCSSDPAFRFPFGWKDRDVDYTKSGTMNGLKQRSL